MASKDAPTDVVVIGAGHNGLVCAGYLARGGLDVTVVERRGIVGGAAVTEEFHPGFRNSVCSYVVSLLNPKVISELELHRFGLEIIERPAGGFVPLPDGRSLTTSRDMAETRRQIAKFSPADAEAYAKFDDAIERAGLVLREMLLETPPNLGGGLMDLLRAGKAGNRLRKLPLADQRSFLDLMTKSIGDYLDGWFESDPIKGVFGYEAVVGNMVSPYSAGSAYVLLHHAIGEVNGRIGAWGYARGGMGAITQAMAKSAEAHGADVRVNSPVGRVIVENGSARGVELVDGTIVRARAVAANVNPKLLYLSLVDTAALDAEFVGHMESWRCRSGSFRMNVALSELPKFDCLEREGGALPPGASIDVSPSLAYLEDAYYDAKTLGWARKPVISMCIPSTLDDGLAPPGQHVASLFCQHFNPDLPDERNWDDAKDEAADLVVDTMTEYAPNFRGSIVGRQVLSPLDLEREFGLVGGDIFHGALHLDQIYSLRPIAGHADYRGPISGLYMCGSGAHPGGGVTGLPGHNAAREILKDFRRKRIAA